MEANEGSGSPKGAPRITTKLGFSFSLWLIQFGAFLMKWKGVYEALMMEIPATETPQAAKIRMDTYGVFSLTAYSHLVDACTGCAVALGIVVVHAATDKFKWANNLLKNLTARFTLQSATRLQNLITEFNSLKVRPEETGALFMDRYNGKVAEINAIDPTELPTVLQRLNILKVAIKEAFPMLFAVMTIKQGETAITK